MSSETKTRRKAKKAKPRTLKPLPMAVHTGQPCEHCGCDWVATAFDFDAEGGGLKDVCANQWCEMIRQLRAIAITLAKLADEKRLNGPEHFTDAEQLANAQRLCSAVLKNELRPGFAKDEETADAR